MQCSSGNSGIKSASLADCLRRRPELQQKKIDIPQRVCGDEER